MIIFGLLLAALLLAVVVFAAAAPKRVRSRRSKERALGLAPRLEPPPPACRAVLSPEDQAFIDSMLSDPDAPVLGRTYVGPTTHRAGTIDDPDEQRSITFVDWSAPATPPVPADAPPLGEVQSLDYSATTYDPGPMADPAPGFEPDPTTMDSPSLSVDSAPSFDSGGGESGGGGSSGEW